MRRTSSPFRLFLAALTSATLTFSPLLPTAVARAGFNPDNVLDDSVLRRADAMSYEEIRIFLASKGGLGNVVDIDPIDGLAKNGAQLIHDAAKRYNVNPQYIMALIQKESSAVETDNPVARQLEWATGYALCDGCFRGSPLAQKYRGLAKQIDAGAGFVDWFFKQAAEGRALRNVGTTYTISGTPVTPLNTGTAALYAYTPHLHGNLLLWTIWNRWFGDGTVGLNYPDGTLARDAKTGAIALVQGNKFRPITNASVLATRFGNIIPVNMSHDVFTGLLEQRGGRPVQFPDLSLIRTEDGKIYLLVGNKKRHIVSMAVFRAIGFNPEEVEEATAADIADYLDGEPITADSVSLAGELWQNSATGGVYFIDGGKKRPLLDRAVLTANFGNQPIARVSPAELDALQTGGPVLFNDGVLVKVANDPAVFVISAGKKRRITSEDAFLSLGYEWTTIVTTTQKMLDLHPEGDPVSIGSLFTMR